MQAFVLSTAPAVLRRAQATTQALCGKPHTTNPTFTRTFLSRLRIRRRARNLESGALRTPSAQTLEQPQPQPQPQLEEEVDPGRVEGTELRVLHYPHPALRAHNAEVDAEEFDEGLKKLAREMFLVMYASRGVGLAAPQVGVNKRLMVFNPDADAKAFLKEVVLVNPEIVGKSKKTIVEGEACLSFPGMQGAVRRHEWVKVEAQRLNGKKFKVKYEGWLAKIFQHEYDHLDGVVYIDKIETEEDRKQVKPRLEQLVREYNENPDNEQTAAL